MYSWVSKRRLEVVGVLFLSSMVLVWSHLSCFMTEGQLRGNTLSWVLFCVVGGCYAQSVRVEWNKIGNGLWMLLWILLLPVAEVYAVELLAGQDAARLLPHLFGFNYFWCLVVTALLFAITSHYRFSIVSSAIFFYLLGTVNHFLLDFRGSPFQLADIRSAGTAMNVAENYAIVLDSDLLLAGSILFLAVSLAIKAQFHFQRRYWYTVVGNLVLLAFLAGAVTHFYSDVLWEKYELEMNFWNPLTCCTDNGTVLVLAMNGKFLEPSKPEQYSPEWVEQIVTAVADGRQRDTVELSQRPNIIVIMNESYADMRVLGDFATSVPYMTFAENLRENTIKGTLLVSMFGGGTCNTEFEFLTGMTMKFLPPGVSVYQTMVVNPLESLATTMREQGYQSIAFHPGKPTSWRRNVVYPYLGFERFLTEEDMKAPQYMRDTFVSDESDYATVIQLFEEKRDKPLFLFNVTIQNHGSYFLDTVGIPKWVRIEGMQGNYPGAAEYFSLMRASDEALERLLTYFQQVDEPTLILFFGDHQPRVEEEFMEELFGKSLESLNHKELQKRYQVPFLLWANYDIAEETYGLISVNYLSTLLLRTAGLEMSAYQQYLAQLYQQIPAMNVHGYIDQDGQHHVWDEETETAAWLKEYEAVQYNYFFDEKGHVPQLFHLYSED